MSALTGNQIQNTYQGLVHLANSTTGVTSVTQSLQDGLGNNLPIQVSNNTVNISGSLLVNGLPIEFTNTGSFATTGSNVFLGNQTVTGSVYLSGAGVNYYLNGTPISVGVGSSGTSGTSGSSGVNGTSGTSGSSGTSPAGFSSGTSGTSGVNGSSGTSGVNGSSGTSGTSGSNGSSGTSGTAGTSGTSGSSPLYSGTSTSSFTLQTGCCYSFTTQTGLAFVAGQPIRIFNSVSNYANANVTSYNSGTGALLVDVVSIVGSGTYTSWTISLAGAAGTNGTSGTSGSNGSSGTSGSNGSSGTSGTSGSDGSSGTSGTSGATGSSGTSGTSGAGIFTQTGSFFATTNDIQITGSLIVTGGITGSITDADNARDIVLYVKNTTGVQIDKGKVVRITGSTGDNALIALADWTDDANSANTLGFVNDNIANDAFGYVTTNGTFIGINTSGYTAGDMLYLSSSGNFTNVKPPAPYHEVRLGQVLRVQQNNGSAYVSVINGFELDELHDVDITNPVVGDLLVYRSGSYGQWVNETGAELGFATTGSNSFVGNQTITGSLIVSSSVGVQSSKYSNIDGQTLSIETNGGVGIDISSAMSLPIKLINPGGQIQITGSLNVTGSVSQKGGNILIEHQNETSPFSVTSSVGGNILFGNGGTLNQSGTAFISGSENILFDVKGIDLSGYRKYVNGSKNIGNVPVLLSTGSLINTNVNSNINSNGAATITQITSSLAPSTQNYSNNLNLSQTQIFTHTSGGLNFSNNIGMGNQINSFATTSFIPQNIQFNTNLLMGTHNFTYPSGSANFDRNIIVGLNGLNYNNLASGSNQNVARNIIGGSGHTFNNNSGSINSGNNVMWGQGHLASLGGNRGMSNTTMLGNSIVVSGSNTNQNDGGAVFVGRFNATGSSQENSLENVFVVGNGTNSANRRNALQIDNNGNSNFTGSVNILGTLNLSGSQPYDLNVTGGARFTTPDGFATNTITANQVGISTVTGTADAFTQIFASTASNAGMYLGVYDDPNFNTDVEFAAIVTSGGTTFNDWDNGVTFGYVPWMSVAPNTGNNPAPQFKRSVGVTGSVNITGQYLVNGTPISSGDRNGLITTGSYGTSDQTISGKLQISGSASQPFSILAGENTAQIDIVNGGHAFYRNSQTYNTVIGNAAGIDDGFTGSNNLLFTGFFLGFKSGSQNTVISGNGAANFRSGSFNTIVGNVGNLQFGSGNTYIGGVSSNTLEDNTLRIAAGNQEILVKSGSNPLEVKGSDLVVSGSLTTTSQIIASGSITTTNRVVSKLTTIDSLTSATASIDLSQGNVFVISDDSTPSGLNLEATNIVDGQQVTILINESNANQILSNSATVVTTKGGGTLQINQGINVLNGATYNGVLYLGLIST